MSEKITTPDIIIERAVELWCRALKRPVYDNGDNSLSGVLGNALQVMVADQQIAKLSDFNAAIEKFRVALVERLKFQRDHHMEFTGQKRPNGEPDRVWFDRCLGVDYHPNLDLKAAADVAGIPSSAFSIKSRVSFYSRDCVMSSFGYGAPYQYHYPLPDGRWLICELSGEQMPLILAAVMDGRLPELFVE